MPKMHKTTNSYCKQCKYHSGMHAGKILCDRYLITGKRRGCEVGWCDKFEAGKPERERTFISLSSRSGFTSAMFDE